MRGVLEIAWQAVGFKPASLERSVCGYTINTKETVLW